jgi:hypothetical protein
MFRILWAVKLIENFYGTTKTDSALFSEKKKLIVKRLTRLTRARHAWAAQVRIPNPTRAARRLGSRPLGPGEYLTHCHF